MSQISVTKARENIYQLLSDVNDNCQPIIITNKNGKNGVLISEDDWNAIQETLYLNSVSDLANTIIDGMNTSIDDCIDENEVEW
ncbi:type II toxin-antitoxin system Phd/YefM family antitoxin [Thomasclavelia saccharogumia]|uniref:type II toxin-antitoxin system Phd/YefM family antitoxin n=1 Tax=Thomasclavelia saccharogumia TaxID=341225 RepID=UPI00047AA81C|nr:type II toxin-antitoxin system Phd/YefM family antitoxin [Thomasclavelia saccharogumia]